MPGLTISWRDRCLSQLTIVALLLHHILLLLLGHRSLLLLLSVDLRLGLDLGGGRLLRLYCRRSLRCTCGNSRWQGERGGRRADRGGDGGGCNGSSGEVRVEERLSCIVSPRWLELQEVFQQVDR